jgi:hypothetical protein
MIRHIVVWKLKAEDDAGKAAAVNVIDGTRSLRVSANSAYFDANWDVVLEAEYDSLEALDAYQVHPEHQAAAAIVRSHVAQRASVDFAVAQ